MPSSWPVFDRLREYFRQGRLHQQERIFQDQSNLDRVMASSEFTDPVNSRSHILSMISIHSNRLDRYRDYDLMDQTGEISLALDLYADESSSIDPERKHTLVIKAKNKAVKKELEELFFSTLLWDKHCRPAARYLAKYGDLPLEIILDRNRSGVASVKFINVHNFVRLETKTSDLVGFYYKDDELNEPVFLHPWQCAHMRLSTFETNYAPYGKSILDGSRRAHKQLKLMEDAALIYRITRASEKRVFKIPVGDVPSKDIPQYLANIARGFKRYKFYNPATGQYDEKYSPLTQEDDIFLPSRSDGTGPTVDMLKGAENLDQIADIEYFLKKMISPLKIPFSRVGIGDGAGEASGETLSSTHNEFAKSVKWLQSELATGMNKIAMVHLALRGYSLDDIRSVEISLSSTSAIDDLLRIEAWQTRVGVMSDLKDIGWFPKEWIVTHFTDLTPDELEELKEMEIAQSGGDDMGDGGGGGGIGGIGMDDLEGDGADGSKDGGGDDLGDDLDTMDSGESDGGESDGEPSAADKSNLLDGLIRKDKELISEYKKYFNGHKMQRIIRSICERRGLPSSNHFTFLNEGNEFAGLPSSDGSATLSESCVDYVAAQNIKEEGRMIFEEYVDDQDVFFDDVITEYDLPVV